ncbi:MAG: M48 family metalloprotease [Nitrospinae bacterium]|nr:M48 family metalloprotease [Nitrospinota bacterium]MBL7019914.1 M48 family metalloprotease [Nitrospinaceae bacterium]
MPKLSIKIFIVPLLILLVLFPPLDAHSVPFISLETEIAMGKGADEQITQQYGIYQDKELQLYVNNIGQNLVSQLSDKVFPRYYFRIVDSSEINAFALPGGYVYVTLGLMSMVNNEAELAGVLGHEIGHIIFHHGAKQMVRNIGAQILSLGGAIASPKNAGQWLAVSTAMFQQINMGYGREAEIESDEQGILNSKEAGYSPFGMSGFLKSLRQKEIMSGQSYHSFQASHPDTRDRIVKAGLLAERMSVQPEAVNSYRDRYLNQIRGLKYEGQKHGGDRKRHEPKYIDIYEVQKGDTFQSIAEKELGSRRKDLDISVMNGRKESSQPKPGELLKLVRNGKFKKDKFLHIKPESAPDAK